MAAGDFETHYTASILPISAARARAGLAPIHAWALKGCVLTPQTTLDPGWVVIDGNKFTAVTRKQPPGVTCLDTKGVILPGLIDLHGHPNWNIFPAWEPPHLYPNRSVWRQSVEYKAVISGPMDRLTVGWTDDRFLRLLARYGEVRALVGGSTAIQGDNSKPDYSSAREPLVRHVDRGPFGVQKAAAIVDPLDPKKAGDVEDVKNGLADHSITAFYVHVAEGIDAKSRDELEELEDAELVTSATVLIHGTGLEESQLTHVRDVGAKLVWSPQSNLRLYGKTTLAAAARKLEIPVAVGADWLPSGSVSLLDELRVARRILAQQDDVIAPSELVRMVTLGAAEIADLADQLGHLGSDRPADLLVLERHHEDAYESVCRSGRTSVELVVIDGRLVYGRDEWFSELAPYAKVFGRNEPDATGERMWAWGRRMRLDLGWPADPADVGFEQPFPRRLSDLRAELLDRYRRIGPIFA